MTKPECVAGAVGHFDHVVSLMASWMHPVTDRRRAKWRSWLGAWILMAQLVPACVAAEGASSIVGTWLVEDGEAAVDVYQCSDEFCGRISWLKEPRFPADDDGGMAGRAKTDRNNPEEARRADPIMGKTILTGLRFNGASWEGGRIYDPESGATYACTARRVAGDRLAIRGYRGFSFLGRTETWTRVSRHE